MTEHERRVNDKDIEAYREFNTAKINKNGVPALGQHYQQIQQKYLYNGMERIGPSEVNQITRNQELPGGPDYQTGEQRLPRSGSFYNSFKRSSQLAAAGSAQIDRSPLVQREAPSPDGNIDPLKLQKVIANMEKDKALQFRQNTGNKGYGFQQALQKGAPEHKLHEREKQEAGDSGAYKFTVAGNYS